MRGVSRIARLAGAAAVVLLTTSLLTGRGLAQPNVLAAEERLERRIQELERAQARYEDAIREQDRLKARVEELEREKIAREGSAGDAGIDSDPGLEDRIQQLELERLAREDQRLEQRVEELETTKVAHEDATRSIIRQSVSRLGSNINEFVIFGGTVEVLTGWEQDFSDNSESTIRLNTAELDFEIQVGDWARGSLIFEYDDGADTLFTTSTDEESGVDRINIDTAFVTLGNVERVPPYAVVGRLIVPFGISTGDPVLDALTINDPLTIELFESREDAIFLGAAFPTRPLAPPVEIPAPPPVQGMLLRPLISRVARSLGYEPLPAPPRRPEFMTLPVDPPPFNVGVYAFQGDTFDRLSKEDEWSPADHWGATVGYRTKGHCQPLLGGQAGGEELGWLHAFCPWTLDVDVDYSHSVFDSNFFSDEYSRWLGQIGIVPGMAASVKANLGPIGLVAEWNGALHDATFNDDIGRRIGIKPSAWQVAFVYQFGWNPWIETLGTQGTYMTVGYSESKDMRGVAQLVDFIPQRTAFVPKKRFLVGIGEWVTDGVRVAVEYAYIKDYSRNDGGTGQHANGFFTMLTYEW
jgi:hypothetical protein